MSEQFATEEYWRLRAEEARTLMDAMTDVEDRRVLSEVIRSYEELARVTAPIIPRKRRSGGRVEGAQPIALALRILFGCRASCASMVPVYAARIENLTNHETVTALARLTAMSRKFK